MKRRATYRTTLFRAVRIPQQIEDKIRQDPMELLPVPCSGDAIAVGLAVPRDLPDLAQIWSFTGFPPQLHVSFDFAYPFHRSTQLSVLRSSECIFVGMLTTRDS